MAEKEKEEGPRSFTRFLERLADGQAQVDLSENLFKLNNALREEALARNGKVTGELNLKIKVAVEENGVAAVAYEIKRKEPQSKAPNSIFFMTSGGNLDVQNPRQAELPLREVGASERVRDVNDNEPATREVD